MPSEGFFAKMFGLNRSSGDECCNMQIIPEEEAVASDHVPGSSTHPGADVVLPVGDQGESTRCEQQDESGH